MKSILPFIFFLICSPAFPQNSRIGTLLHRINSVYANASTHRDHGEVEISFKSRSGRHSDIKPFKTVFDRYQS